MDGGDADVFNEDEQPTAVPGLVVLALTLALCSLGGLVRTLVWFDHYYAPSPTDWGAAAKWRWILVAALAWSAVVAGLVGVPPGGRAAGRILSGVAVVIGVAVGLLAGFIAVLVLVTDPVVYSSTNS